VTRARLRPRHRRRLSACGQARASSSATALLPCSMGRLSPGDRSVHASLLAGSPGRGFCHLCRIARCVRRHCRAETAGNRAAANPAVKPRDIDAPVVVRNGARAASSQTATASAGCRPACACVAGHDSVQRRDQTNLPTQLRWHRTHTNRPTLLKSAFERPLTVHAAEPAACSQHARVRTTEPHCHGSFSLSHGLVVLANHPDPVRSR
jgi:hypothetical protein